MISFFKRQFLPQKSPQPLETPVYLFCYHKVGTILLAKVFREICSTFGWRFKSVIGRAEEIPSDADVILFMHSLVDLSQVERAYVGVHFIRDPRDVIVSGYLYHKRCSEDWCVNQTHDTTEPIFFPNLPWSQQHKPEDWKRDYIESLQGKSYQQNLLNRSQSEGILFELNHYGTWTIESMLDWDYNNPRVKEVRFESVMRDFDGTFRNIFNHLSFSENQVKRALRIARKEDLSRKSDRQLRANKHVSSRDITKWKQYFDSANISVFRQRFGETLLKLGYEKDNQW